MIFLAKSYTLNSEVSTSYFVLAMPGAQDTASRWVLTYHRRVPTPENPSESRNLSLSLDKSGGILRILIAQPLARFHAPGLREKSGWVGMGIVIAQPAHRIRDSLKGIKFCQPTHRL